MKKFAMLFALLGGLILIMIGALPQAPASAQCIAYVCPPTSTPIKVSGQNKKKPTPVPTNVPTDTATATSVAPQPYPSPYPSPYPGPKPTKYPGPKPTPTPISPFPPPTLPPFIACGWPCTIFGPVHIGDPVEFIIGALVVLSLLVGLFIFIRGRLNMGDGSVRKGGTLPEEDVNNGPLQ